MQCRHYQLPSMTLAEEGTGLVHLAERATLGLQHLFAAGTAVFCWTALEAFDDKSPALGNAVCKFLQHHLAPTALKAVAPDEADSEDALLMVQAVKSLGIHDWLCKELGFTSGPSLNSAIQGFAPHCRGFA